MAVVSNLDRCLPPHPVPRGPCHRRLNTAAPPSGDPEGGDTPGWPGRLGKARLNADARRSARRRSRSLSRTIGRWHGRQAGMVHLRASADICVHLCSESGLSIAWPAGAGTSDGLPGWFGDARLDTDARTSGRRRLGSCPGPIVRWHGLQAGTIHPRASTVICVHLCSDSGLSTAWPAGAGTSDGLPGWFGEARLNADERGYPQIHADQGRAVRGLFRRRLDGGTGGRLGTAHPCASADIRVHPWSESGGSAAYWLPPPDPRSDAY
jgi:hypothetical protein